MDAPFRQYRRGICASNMFFKEGRARFRALSPVQLSQYIHPSQIDANGGCFFMVRNTYIGEVGKEMPALSNRELADRSSDWTAEALSTPLGSDRDATLITRSSGEKNAGGTETSPSTSNQLIVCAGRGVGAVTQ